MKNKVFERWLNPKKGQGYYNYALGTTEPPRNDYYNNNKKK